MQEKNYFNELIFHWFSDISEYFILYVFGSHIESAVVTWYSLGNSQFTSCNCEWTHIKTNKHQNNFTDQLYVAQIHMCRSYTLYKHKRRRFQCDSSSELVSQTSNERAIKDLRHP